MIGAGLTTWVVLWLTADKRTAQIGSKVEDNDIVQGGTVVATVTGATVDRVGSRAHFGQVSGGPYFNKELEFEFRALRLKLVNAAIVNNAAGAQTLFGVQCDIVPEAARWGK